MMRHQFYVLCPFCDKVRAVGALQISVIIIIHFLKFIIHGIVIIRHNTCNGQRSETEQNPHKAHKIHQKYII